MVIGITMVKWVQLCIPDTSNFVEMDMVKCKYEHRCEYKIYFVLAIVMIALFVTLAACEINCNLQGSIIDINFQSNRQPNDLASLIMLHIPSRDLRSASEKILVVSPIRTS